MSKPPLLRRQIVLVIGATLIVAAIVFRWMAYR
jgi:hypothetical protein